MRHVSEYLIGFDLRVPDTVTIGHWSKTRRKAHLLKPEISYPLSVDPKCWQKQLPNDDPVASILGLTATDAIASPPPSITVDLWPCFGTLEYYARHFQGCYGGLDEAVFVAITRIHSGGGKLSRRYPSGTVEWADEIGQIPRFDSDWRISGYDVADANLTSGLMNCGVTVTTTPSRDNMKLRNALNDQHLVSGQEAAVEAASYLNAWVPEHAPFFAYGLYVKKFS